MFVRIRDCKPIRERISSKEFFWDIEINVVIHTYRRVRLIIHAENQFFWPKERA